MATLILTGGAKTISASALLSTNTSSLGFGNVAVGKSTSYQVLVTNVGTSAVKISQVSTQGTGFKTTYLALPVTLEPAKNFVLNISFTPTIMGSVSGSVEVFSNATNSPTKTSLSGKGLQPQITAVPGSAAFGSVSVGTTNSQTVTLQNPGNDYLHITQISVKGTGFSLSGVTLPLNVAPGRSSAFTVRFAPKSVGAVTGDVAVVSNAPNSLFNIPLGGSGTVSSVQLSANTSSLSFGSVTVGTTAMKTVTLSNKGNANVSVSGIKVSGTGYSASGYEIPFTLSVGQSTTFDVKFAPTVSGSSTGTAAVTSTASNSPNAILLSGTGTLTSTHAVVLSWAPSGSSVVGYHIYRGTQSSGPFSKLTPSVVASTSYTDSTVLANSSYFYVATAVDAAGAESSFSNKILVAVP